MAIILLPAAWTVLTAGDRSIAARAPTVGGALDDLFREYPSLRERVLGSDGGVVSYINVFVDKHNVRDLQGFDTPLTNESVIRLIPALAGG
jgi:molybdopterin converting factor small subunit